MDTDTTSNFTLLRPLVLDEGASTTEKGIFILFVRYTAISLEGENNPKNK